MVQLRGQGEFAVRMEWGQRGAEEISQDADYAVIVDVLSFTTAVSVALDRGAEVFPYPWRDQSAAAFARRHGAVLAVGRSEAALAGDASGRSANAGPLVSLSPASIRAASGLDRIVLPSPNGSALSSALAGSGRQILSACLRNRIAVASWLANQAGDPGPRPVIAVIAAGERWPDGTLRAAVEDLWGAGAVISALDRLGVTRLSPEARAAAAAWRSIEAQPEAALASCTSGAELADGGFGADVTIAGEVDTSGSVPVLTRGRFADVLDADARGPARSPLST
jgi:2-phosphosulfolactate phosphatase